MSPALLFSPPRKVSAARRPWEPAAARLLCLGSVSAPTPSRKRVGCVVTLCEKAKMMVCRASEVPGLRASPPGLGGGQCPHWGVSSRKRRSLPGRSKRRAIKCAVKCAIKCAVKYTVKWAGTQR